jgi:hypothetical protein
MDALKAFGLFAVAAMLLRSRGSQPLVCAGVRRRVRLGGLRFPARRIGLVDAIGQ